MRKGEARQAHILTKEIFDKEGTWLQDTFDGCPDMYVQKVRRDHGVFIQKPELQFIPWHSIIRITFD